MSELKTLKDIYGRSYQDCHCGEYNEGCNSCLRKDIKAEAVKWVKHSIELQKKDFVKNVIPTIFQKQQSAVQSEFMNFFNLTEEDLKEEQK